MRGRDWGLLVLLSLLWGGAFFFYKVLDEAGLPPLSIVLGRVGIATLAILPVLRLSRLSLPARLGDWVPFAVLGITNNIVPFVLIAWGETQIASGLASILNAMTPIFTAIVAHYAAADERFSANKIAGIALSFAGMIVLVGADVARGLNLTSLAQLACLGATVSYSFGIVYGKRLRATPPLTIATGQLIASTILVLPLELAIDKPWTIAPPALPAWLALAAMAVLGTSAAYVVYFSILKTSGAVNASLVTLLVPVVALILGGVFLHEHLQWTMLAGMLLISIGLLVLDGRVVRAMNVRPFGTTRSERQTVR
ncbi:MAG: DMT family transporter [Vulcanimicrobiaceae bacterium]